jgi:hypothetical protein
LASSPRCRSCGFKALRYRKRAKEFVCRKCGAVVQEAELALRASVDNATRPAKQRSSAAHAARRLRQSTASHLEVAKAVEQLDEAASRVESAASEIYDRNSPFGCLPFLLALGTGAIVGAVTARTLRWYWAGALALAGTATTLFLLLFVRTRSWTREHPLLAEMSLTSRFGLRHGSSREDFVGLSSAIVMHYLPDDQSRELLDTLQAAELHAVDTLQRFGLLDDDC